MQDKRPELTEEEQSLLEHLRERDDSFGEIAEQVLQLEEERRS